MAARPGRRTRLPPVSRSDRRHRPAAAALLGLLIAASIKPFVPAALTGLLTVLGTLLVALGVKHVSGREVSAVNVVIAIVMANVPRAHVSPVSGAPHGNPAGAERIKQKCRL